MHSSAQTSAGVIVVTPQDLSARWQRASERAKLPNVIVTPIDSVGTYHVTSASHPGVAYATDGLNCTCQAAQFGDEICLHRAAVRDYQAAQIHCIVCGGGGWEHVSIWDWRAGQAVDLYSIRCSCGCQEPEPPAPAAAQVQRELADATAALATIDALLRPFNENLEQGDGSYADRHSRKHDALLHRRELAQQRVWDVQDRVTGAETGQVAA
jgi:hypothetical protein